MQQRDHLDKATAVLLASLIVRGCSLVWRHHNSGGAVLEDIGGDVVTADLPAVNGCPCEHKIATIARLTVCGEISPDNRAHTHSGSH